ncbi:hypothetical protein JHK87_001493 [Glycine soja]|nr:hypothetical protein JHK87_001493 [Glycine soja]
MPTELGQQIVELSTLVTHAANDKSSDLLQCVSPESYTGKSGGTTQMSFECIKGVRLAMTLLTSLLMIWCQRKKTRKTRQKVARETEKPQSNETIKPDYAVTPGWPVQFPLFLPTTLHVQPSHLELEGIQSMLQESKRVLQRFQKQEENMLQFGLIGSKSYRDMVKYKYGSKRVWSYIHYEEVPAHKGNLYALDAIVPGDREIKKQEIEFSKNDALQKDETTVDHEVSGISTDTRQPVKPKNWLEIKLPKVEPIIEQIRSEALDGSATNASEDSNQKNKKFGTAEDEYLKDASVEPGIRNHKKLEPAT